MYKAPSHPLPRRRRTGLSLVELLISLAITSMLLTAVAASYSASASAIKVNDEFFRATQAGRVSLGQMLAQIRQSEWCQVGTDDEYNAAEATINTANPIASVTDKTILHVLTPMADENTPDTRFSYWQNKNLTYVYDATSQTIKLQTDDDTTDADYTLASNISSCSFTSDIEQNPQTKKGRVVRVTITLVVQVGGNNVKLCGSAVPRRVMVYQ